MDEHCINCNNGVITLWREMEINPELIEFRDNYISPPCIFYPTLTQALEAWEEIHVSDI